MTPDKIDAITALWLASPAWAAAIYLTWIRPARARKKQQP